jgi:chemotaxis-related protein WspD
LEEWTARLAEDKVEEPVDVQGVVLFRLGNEWLALPAGALHEVISLRPIHRIPFHGGLLAGVVNVRGELHLAIRLDHLLGLTHRAEANGESSSSDAGRTAPRLLVAGRDGETWVFRVDEVDRVHRLAMSELQSVPPTLGRSTSRFTRGVFRSRDRAVGLLDERHLFEAVRTSVR